MQSADLMWDIIAWASLPLLILLAGVIFFKRLHREFPFFTSYVALTFIIGILRFVAYKKYSPHAYFIVYWSTDFVVLLTTFLTIYEIFLRRLFSGFASVRFYRYLFPVVAVIISAAAFFLALHTPDQRATFQVISRIFDFLRSAVIGFFVLLLLLMGRSFTGRDFSIASGFGIQAAAALANAAVKIHLGRRSATMDRVEQLTYDVACLIWLWSFAKGKSYTPEEPQPIDPKALQEARVWEKSLKDFVGPGKN